MYRIAHIPHATLAWTELLLALLSRTTLDAAEREFGGGCDGYAVAFSSGRGALAAAIEVLDASAVEITAFTCAAVPSAVIGAGSSPSFLDDEACSRPAWSGRSPAIVQDTYGFRGFAPATQAFIRDIAHGMPPYSRNGAAISVTSFELSKPLSPGRGGLAITDSPALAEQLRTIRDRYPEMPGGILSWLSTMCRLIERRFALGGGKYGAGLARRAAGLLRSPVLVQEARDEASGKGVGNAVRGRPDRISLGLMVSQFRKASAVAEYRRHIVNLYDRRASVVREALPLVRYPMVVDSPTDFEQAMRGRGWSLASPWYAPLLSPAETNVRALGYKPGDAPLCEALSGMLINLPTHPLVSEATAASLIDDALELGAKPWLFPVAN